VATPAVAEHAEDRHGRDWLDHDDPVKNQVPESKRAPEPVGCGGCRSRGFHFGVLDYARAGAVNVKANCDPGY